LIQNALWWVGVYGFDAIRQDTVPYVARDFWQGWHAALRAEFPELTTLGEVNLPDAAVNAFYQRGKRGFDGMDAGFDLLYDFPLESGMIAAFAHGEPLQRLGFTPGSSDIAGALAHDSLYPNPDALVTFLGLHDTTRFLGRKGATLAGLKLGATFLFTSRGIPLWYYGDEVALSGGDDPDNRRHFPGGFPGDKANKFTPEGRTTEEEALFQHIKRLTHLRATHPVLRHGTTRVLHAQGQHYAYARVQGNELVLVALNNDSEKPATLTLDLSELKLPVGTRLTDALTSARVTVASPALTLTLAPRSAQVLVR
jgi:glycosidase